MNTLSFEEEEEEMDIIKISHFQITISLLAPV